MTTALTGVPLRLHGPMQAWGGSVVGDNRPTLAFPTRSGVLGLVAACMGIRRSEVDRLLALADGSRVHVRVDAYGTLLIDDQTIQDNPNASTTRQTIQSKRTYLCDASFVAIVVPGPTASSKGIAEALRAPVFSPFLGRRCCVPSTPLYIVDEVSGDDAVELFSSITREPMNAASTHANSPHQDFYLDLPDFPGALRRVPIRDEPRGPLARQWRERFALHVRTYDRAPENVQP